MKNVICLERPGGLLDRIRRLAVTGSDIGFSLTTCAEDSDSVLSLCKRLRPVMLILEESDAQPLEIGKLRKAVPPPDLHILIVSTGQDGSAMEHYLRLGCSGVIPRAVSDETFGRAVHAIFDGEIWVPRKVLSRLVQSFLFGEPERRLTRREVEVLKLICLGSTNQQIADELFISRETVRWHVRSLYSKIGVNDRGSAILYALDLGFNKAVSQATLAPD